MGAADEAADGGNEKKTGDAEEKVCFFHNKASLNKVFFCYCQY